MCKKLVYCSIAYSLYKNKINGQIQAWKRLGFTCSLISIELTNSEYSVFFIDGNSLHMETRKELFSSKSKKKAIAFAFNYILKCYNDSNTFIYIRRLGIYLIFTGLFFKKIKSSVIYEIPTYPIDGGTNLLRKIIVTIEQMYFRVFVYPYIKAMPAFVQRNTRVTPSKIIPIYNAVNVLETNDEIRKRDSGRYTFLFVGNLQQWHGLEKFANLVVNYKGKYEIALKIYSSDTECYKELFSKYSCFDKIVFCGLEKMSAISKTIDKKTIGIGGLDYSKRGAEYDTSLKNKDYAAMGIPFVYSLKDLSFNEYLYGLQISGDEINDKLIDRIILWFESIDSEDLGAKIQEYAKKNLTYDKQIETVYRRIECNT